MTLLVWPYRYYKLLRTALVRLVFEVSRVPEAALRAAAFVQGCILNQTMSATKKLLLLDDVLLSILEVRPQVRGPEPPLELCACTSKGICDLTQTRRPLSNP